MSCQCEIYEICPQCAPSPQAFAIAVRNHNDVVRRMKPSSKSYTLDDLQQLARVYCDQWEHETESTQTEFRLGLSLLFEWLRKRERVGGA